MRGWVTVRDVDVATPLRNKLFLTDELRGDHTTAWHVGYGVDFGPIRAVHEFAHLSLYGVDTPAGGEEDLEELTAWQVEAALAELDDDHRKVLVEVHWRGRPYQEVADDLGIPTGTVKSRVYYGLRAMRTSLEAQGWRDG